MISPKPTSLFNRPKKSSGQVVASPARLDSFIRAATISATSPQTAFVELNLTDAPGMVYVYVTGDPLAPPTRRWKNGAGADFHTAVATGTEAVQIPGPSGLRPDTEYYAHLLFHRHDGASDVLTRRFQTPGTDPFTTLISTATIDVFEDTALMATLYGTGASGVLYWVASLSPALPQPDQIRHAFETTPSAGKVVLTPNGPEDRKILIRGLSQAPHWVHFLHDDTDADTFSTFSEGPVVPTYSDGPIVSAFEMVTFTDSTADLAFSTDTPTGTARIVALPADAPVPDAHHIICGIDAAQARVPNVSARISAAGHTTVRLAGLDSAQAYRFLIAHQDAAGNLSPVQEHLVQTSLDTAPDAPDILWSEWQDGNPTGDSLGGLVVTGGYPDHTGAPRAILIANDGLGSRQMLKYTDHHTPVHARAQTWFGIKAKAVAHASEKAWLRFHLIDFGVSEYGWIDITNDGTPVSERIGRVTRRLQNIQVTALDDGYFDIYFELNSTKFKDTQGRLLFRYASVNKKLGISSNRVPGAYQLALTDARGGVVRDEI